MHEHKSGSPSHLVLQRLLSLLVLLFLLLLLPCTSFVLRRHARACADLPSGAVASPPRQLSPRARSMLIRRWSRRRSLPILRPLCTRLRLLSWRQRALASPSQLDLPTRRHQLRLLVLILSSCLALFLLLHPRLRHSPCVAPPKLSSTSAFLALAPLALRQRVLSRQSPAPRDDRSARFLLLLLCMSSSDALPLALSRADRRPSPCSSAGAPRQDKGKQRAYEPEITPASASASSLASSSSLYAAAPPLSSAFTSGLVLAIRQPLQHSLGTGNGKERAEGLGSFVSAQLSAQVGCVVFSFCPRRSSLTPLSAKVLAPRSAATASVRPAQ